MRGILDYSQRFGDCRVAVVGDFMLDEYVWGHIDRISPEAPVPILNVVRRETALGGAGNVVRNLCAIGIKVTAIGIVGDDRAGTRVRNLIEDLGVDAGNIICDRERNSTRKVRLMSLEHGQQVFRVDQETVQPVRQEIEDKLVSQIVDASFRPDVILCSDYLKGVLTDRVLRSSFDAARLQGIPALVAPKGSESKRYEGATVLMPNQKELAQLTQTSIDGNSWLANSAGKLIEKLGLQALIVTRGKDGMSLFETKSQGTHRVDIPTMARTVYDVTGAGDTAISVFAGMIAAGANLEAAVYAANLAGGIKVAKRGTNTVTLEEIYEHLSERHGSSVALSNAQVASQ